MSCINGRTDPDLWEKSKKKAIAKMGGRFSARAMQLAGKLYRDAGGGYCGARTKAQKSMEKWTGEDWTTASGDKACKTVDGKTVCDRYLPRKAWSKLTKAQKAATRRKKRGSSAQFVPNTKKAAAAGASARRESYDLEVSMSVTARMKSLLREANKNFWEDPNYDDMSWIEPKHIYNWTLKGAYSQGWPRRKQLGNNENIQQRAAKLKQFFQEGDHWLIEKPWTVTKATPRGPEKIQVEAGKVIDIWVFRSEDDPNDMRVQAAYNCRDGNLQLCDIARNLVVLEEFRDEIIKHCVKKTSKELRAMGITKFNCD